MPLNDSCQRSCHCLGYAWHNTRYYALQVKRVLVGTRLTIVLFISACLQVNANGFSQPIVLSERNATLQSIFKKIEQQTGYLFWYEDDLIKHAKKVTIQIRSNSLNEVLNQCLKNQPLSYTIIEKTVVIKHKALSSSSFSEGGNSFFKLKNG